MGIRAAAIVAVVMVTGCKYGAEEFACSPEKSCGPGGACESNGFCSFEDNSCESHRRFGELGGANSGACVPIGGAQMIDASIDAPPDVPPDARACFGTGIVQVCLAQAPAMPFNNGDLTTIDTGDTSATSKCAATVSGGENYCVIAGTSISITGALRATGSKPLVLLSTSTITVSQLIDVGSHRGAPEFVGAGADPTAACAMGGAAGGSAPGLRSGGAGGSFNGKGGHGGDGAGAGAGNGGQAINAVTPTVLRGGCAGQSGDGGAKGAGGHGGGAVYLLAVDRIDISGPGINAAGEGGAPGTSGASGAGGGGAGGMIGFDAPTITCTGFLIANGGGGGEGSGITVAGMVGADPSQTSTNAALGGNGFAGIGGDGGNGSSGAAAGAGANGKDGTSMGGADGAGGAGGGGAGFIKGPAASLGNNVSPDATP